MSVVIASHGQDAGPCRAPETIGHPYWCTAISAFDELANKCVIYVASDALVSISYAGLAFIQRQPTDVWLAETLDADVRGGPHMAVRVGGSSERRITLGAAINRVASRLARDIHAMPAGERGRVTLQLVGWQWKTHRPRNGRPIAWCITNDGVADATTVERLPRYWGWERGQAQVSAIGDRRSDPAGAVVRRIGDRTELFAEFAEQLLVETIREASAATETGGSIGADCIAVWMKLSDGNVRVRYLPGSAASAGYDVYTPWIVWPTIGASAPSVLTGGLPSLHMGDLEFVFERDAAFTPSGLSATMGSVKRPAPP